MLSQPFVLATVLLTLTPMAAFQNEATAQAEVRQQADEGDASAQKGQTEGARRQAVPRGAVRPVPSPAPTPVVSSSAGPPQAAAAADDQRRGGSRERGNTAQTGGAVQRGERPRNGNPITGRAVPRESRPAPGSAGPPQPNRREGNGGRTIYVAPPAYNYYYYPRRYYPYGYGAFGLGYFYYDPYAWYPPSYYGGDNGYFDIGEVRLAVSPRSADVYVDGYYAGRVDDFDGTFQALKLESGVHHIQIVSAGYLPLDFDVRLNPGQKITYRGDLRH